MLDLKKVIPATTEKITQDGYTPNDVLLLDRAGKNQLYTFPGADSSEILTWLYEYLQGEGQGCSECLIALDYWTDEAMGTTRPAAVLLIHCRAGEDGGQYRVGVIEYDPADPSPAATALPVNWKNQSWREAMKEPAQAIANLLERP